MVKTKVSIVIFTLGEVASISGYTASSPIFLAQLVPSLKGNMWPIRSEWMAARRAFNAPTLLHLHPCNQLVVMLPLRQAVCYAFSTSTCACFFSFFYSLFVLLVIVTFQSRWVVVLAAVRVEATLFPPDLSYSLRTFFFFIPIIWSQNVLMVRTQNCCLSLLFFILYMKMIISLKLYSQSWFIAFLE